MTLLLLMLILIALFLQQTISHPHIHSDPRMVNGIPSFASRFPFIAVIRVVQYDTTNRVYAGEAYCGASLIRKEYPAAFLSASHCVYNDTDEAMLQLYATDTDQQPILGLTGFPILAHIVHEEFDHVSLANDISLLFIDADLTARNELQTVTIPNLINPLSSVPSPCCTNSDILQVIGYGRTSLGGSYSNTLEYTNLKYLGINGCNRQYCLLQTRQANCPFNYVLTMNICAVGNQTTPCHGDSGGPLIKLGTTEQVGVVSWGIGCISWLPTIFTNTGLYYEWIYDKLDQHQGNDIQWPIYPWTPTSHPTLFTDFPSIQPTNYPTASPTNYPSVQPTNRPTGHPINHPTMQPSKHPSRYPSNNPSLNPTNIPTNDPSFNPTFNPSYNPTNNPSYTPTILPSVSPSDTTVSPTRNPTPTLPFPSPTPNPTPYPTPYPTQTPTYSPTTKPTSSQSPTNPPTTTQVTDNPTTWTNPILTGFPNPTSPPSVAFSTAIPTSTSIPDTTADPTESSKPKQTYITTEDTVTNNTQQTVALELMSDTKNDIGGIAIALCVAGSMVFIIIGCILLQKCKVNQVDHKSYETVTSIAEIDKSNVTVIEPLQDEDIPSETDAIIDYNTIKATETIDFQPIATSLSSGDGKNDASLSLQ